MCGSLAGWFQVAIQAVDWFVPEHHLCIGLRCRFCEVGWFQVAIQAVDWFVPEHHLCIGLRCRFCEVLSAFDAWWHANSPLLGATICPLGV